MAALASLTPACAIEGPESSGEGPGESAALGQDVGALSSLGTTVDTPVRLALDIDNGVGAPLKVRAGQKFFLNQLDIRTAITANVDEGIAGLSTSGDFNTVSWAGVSLQDTEPLASPNPDGTYTRRRFYRSAAWMKTPSWFSITQVDTKGVPTAVPVLISAGREDQIALDDSFFIRRFRAIQWAYDCPTASSCTGASHFEEEALIELRNARDSGPVFKIAPNTAALDVRWTLKPAKPWRVPVTQVSNPTYDYGATADIVPLTPPGPEGYYAPGQDVTFQLTLRDGAGKALHDPSALPSYDDAVAGQSEAGIQYYRAFFDPTATYWRRKHRERMLMAQIVGPAHKIQPIRTIVAGAQFFRPLQQIATPENDGVFSQFNTIPTADVIWGGQADPNHVAWSRPVSDTWTYHLPDNAEAGTYLVTLKGRRTYLGEDIPFTTTIQIQVGTTVPTMSQSITGGCNQCHSGSASLKSLLHANDNRAACAGCHAPLEPELEGPIYVRVHYLHSRSSRFPAPKSQCSSCHIGAQSVQRTSKSACLSCHTSYPASHVAKFGPIISSYVGGGTESFQQCAKTCHQVHPYSGL